MEQISTFTTERLKAIKTYIPDTLFALDFKKDIQRGICPKCFNKLRVMRNGGVICNGVKHAKAFVLPEKKYNEIRS